MESNMPKRELFMKILNYEKFDHMPVLHWVGWDEFNIKLEKETGVGVYDQAEYFDAESIGVKSYLDMINTELYPPFEEEVIEETDKYSIVRAKDGVVLKKFKEKSSIPHFIDFTLKDRSSLKEYKKRLRYTEERFEKNWVEKAQGYKDLGNLIIFNAGSMIGWIRNWMGVENLAITLYDDPDMIRELVDVTSDMVCKLAERVAKEIQIDIGSFWEDICFRNGPLVSPKHFKEIAGPGYKKITSTMKNLGVDHSIVDCDGVVESLVPIWLDNGIDVIYPFEIGVWNADPMEYRKKFGKELRIIGGVDKRVLYKSYKEIDDEIERRIPLMKEGGYIPMLDHLLPPDTDLDKYRYYLEKIRSLRF